MENQKMKLSKKEVESELLSAKKGKYLYCNLISRHFSIRFRFRCKLFYL